MKAIIEDNRWIRFENIPPDVDDLLYEYFSAEDPNSRYISDVSEQNWDGIYRKYNRRFQKISKGFLIDIIKLFKKHDIPLDIEDYRPPTKYPMFREEDVKPDMLSDIELMDYQLNGIKKCALKNEDELYLNEIGIIYFTTGSGKTELICGIAKLLNCPTVIVAEETVVIDQIKRRLELRNITDDVGVFYAGQSPSGQLICVGSLASLMPPPKLKRKKSEKQESFDKRIKAYKTRLKNHQIYRKLLSKCELLMIDECDRAVNMQYKKLVLQYTNSRYIYGFTGTMPMVEDKLDILNLKELCGNIIVESDRRYLEKIGRIIPVKYIMMVFGDDDRKNKMAFDIAIKELIEENEKLHQKVKQITDGLPNDNFLILVENIALGNALEQIISGSKFIHGSTSRKERNRVLKEFEEKEIRILIGSKILSRGLDLRDGIDNLVLCASSKKNANLEQKVGRALRINKRGWARVFDLMYVNSYYLYKHSRMRLKRMIQLGYPTTVATQNGNICGEDVIKKGFNLTKYIN